MASIGESVGGIISAFGRPKEPKQIRVNPYVQESLDSFRRGYDALLGERASDSAAFRTALQAATPEAAKVSAETSDYLRNLIKGTTTYDPLESGYKPLGEYLFSKAAAIAPAALNLTRAGDAANRINLGLAPGAGSSVADRARMAAIGRILSENYGNTLRALDSGAAQLYGQRAGERAAGVTALDRLAIEPDRLAYRELIPSELRSAGMAQDLNTLRNLVEGYKQNVAGYQENPSGLDRWGKAAGGLVDLAAGIYTGGASSLLGGMGGGGGGGGGAFGGFVPTSGGAAPGDSFWSKLWTGFRPQALGYSDDPNWWLGDPQPMRSYRLGSPGWGVPQSSLPWWYNPGRPSVY